MFDFLPEGLCYSGFAPSGTCLEPTHSKLVAASLTICRTILLGTRPLSSRLSTVHAPSLYSSSYGYMPFAPMLGPWILPREIFRPSRTASVSTVQEAMHLERDMQTRKKTPQAKRLRQNAIGSSGLEFRFLPEGRANHSITAHFDLRRAVSQWLRIGHLAMHDPATWGLLHNEDRGVNILGQCSRGSRVSRVYCHLFALRVDYSRPTQP